MPIIRILLVIAVLIALLSASYIGLSVYLRRQRRKELETEHAAGQGAPTTREVYVARGMAEYDRSMPKKLLVGVFALPLIVFLGMVVLANLS